MLHSKMGNNALQTSCHEQGPIHEISGDVFPAHLATEHPTDGGYGWVCLAACFSINCFTWGVVAVRFRKATACLY
jgi:hypothetical protein